MFVGIVELMAQELPLINQFYPEDYNAESQNWCISQSENGFVYVANNSGLLEFNGVTWKVYPTPNETIMRSVKVFENKIFTGFYMDFGFWKKNEFGILEYTSLVKEKKLELLEDEQFWNIVELDGWVLFQSLQRVYLYNLKTEEITKINATNYGVITKIFEVDDSVYFQETGKGVFKIEKGKAVLVSDNEIFKNQTIVLSFKEGSELVFLTNDLGFYTIDKPYVFPNNELNNILKGKAVYTAIKLKNGDFVIGTISNGLIYSSKNGEVLFELNQRLGLTNNTVLTTFEDKNNDIWLGLDNGLNKIDVSSSVKTYKDIKGALGTVYTSKLYKGYLYLGTNQGLFCKKYPSKSDFNFVKNTQGQVWHLTVIDDILFCGHNSGTYVVDNGSVEKTSNIQGAWGVKKITKDLLLQGNYDGLYIFEKENNGWQFRNKIEGFNRSSRFFELHNDIIFVNHEYKGVFKLKIDKELKKVLNIEIDSSISKGAHSSLIKFQGNIIYAYKEGVFKYNDNSNSFLKDTLLDKLIDKNSFSSGRLIYDEKSNNLFSFSEEHINYIRPDKFSSSSVIVKKCISNKLRKGAVGYENIENLNNGNYLMGVLDGYLITDLSNEEKEEYEIAINSIKNYKLNQKERFLKLNETPSLDYKFNNLEFNYGVPYFSKDKKVVYQYTLEGYTENWSDWTENHTVLFENITGGDYIFKVRARIGNKLIDNPSEYSFSIEKPWYSSNLALFFYFLTVGVLVFFMDRFYKNYYRKQREKLLEKKEKEFQLKTLENEKELIEIKNEQLKQDVESKNRELAISTMSMIKKNELLSSIKKEILNKADNDSVKTVTKIIDKNLNNTNDWKMFEEAFNNADKDFINKLKSKHNNLTPNDLRLCAYLRLNLSSKEIAPLLNISPRSVEVKRYRLRKKMELAHNTNLTSYILEI